MKQIALILALVSFTVLASCQKCTAGSSCTSGTQAAIDLVINDNSALSTSLKQSACSALTASQTSFGTGCTIKWQ